MLFVVLVQLALVRQRPSVRLLRKLLRARTDVRGEEAVRVRRRLLERRLHVRKRVLRLVDVRPDVRVKMLARRRSKLGDRRRHMLLHTRQLAADEQLVVAAVLERERLRRAAPEHCSEQVDDPDAREQRRQQAKRRTRLRQPMRALTRALVLAFTGTCLSSGCVSTSAETLRTAKRMGGVPCTMVGWGRA